jgi:predicted nucleic acid-binding protein
VILVDSSVWIDYFRDADTPQVAMLDGLFGRSQLAVGDLIVTEVLQGVRDDREFNLVRKTLDAFTQADLVGHDIAVKAARNFRKLRAMGVTVCKTIDSLIATRCIENGWTLLHADRDFDAFAMHLGLRVAFSET